MDNNNNPALVAWVAEHVMGWRCYHHKDHNIQDIDDLCIAGGYKAIVEYSQTGDAMFVVPFVAEFGPTVPWNPLTDANDDLMVLQKVRDEWLCEDLFTFECEYSAALAVRDVDGVRGVELHILQHVVGDYARAAAQAKGYKP
jgi:hypothetical protein